MVNAPFQEYFTEQWFEVKYIFLSYLNFSDLCGTNSIFGCEIHIPFKIILHNSYGKCDLFIDYFTEQKFELKYIFLSYLNFSALCGTNSIFGCEIYIMAKTELHDFYGVIYLFQQYFIWQWFKLRSIFLYIRIFWL